MKTPFLVFIALQALDLTTTMVALALGAHEQNPLVSHFMSWGPLWGLIFSKLVVLSIAGVGAMLHKNRSLWLANYVFCAIVAWNVVVIARMTLLA